MTITVPATLVEMRAELRQRCQLDVNDPRATDAILNRIINFAMHRFQIANPNGWPWDFSEWTTTATIGVDTYPFSIGAGVALPTKVRYVMLRDPAGAFEYPLDRVTRYDQLERYPNDSEGGGPRTFCLLGQSAAAGGTVGMCMKLRPTPDKAYGLRIGGATPSADLVADTDPQVATNDFMISDWVDTMLMYAAFLVYRMRVDLAEAVLGSKAEFDADVIETRRTVRTKMGAGRGMNPLADDRELQ